jgi:hypothetical protein
MWLLHCMHVDVYLFFYVAKSIHLYFLLLNIHFLCQSPKIPPFSLKDLQNTKTPTLTKNIRK